METKTNMNDIEQFMPEARQLAAQCWCDEATKGRVMDPDLAEAVARRIAAWMGTAAQHVRNEQFYRGLLVKIGEPFGVEAKTSDDGSVQQDVLVLKVPELVEALRARSLPAVMTSAISDVLSLMIDVTGQIGRGFREFKGVDIPRKIEAEQAYVLFWLLGYALKHGDDWRRHAALDLPVAPE